MLRVARRSAHGSLTAQAFTNRFHQHLALQAVARSAPAAAGALQQHASRTFRALQKQLRRVEARRRQRAAAKLFQQRTAALPVRVEVRAAGGKQRFFVQVTRMFSWRNYFTFSA